MNIFKNLFSVEEPLEDLLPNIEKVDINGYNVIHCFKEQETLSRYYTPVETYQYNNFLIVVVYCKPSSRYSCYVHGYSLENSKYIAYELERKINWVSSKRLLKEPFLTACRKVNDLILERAGL